jgi:hypothetical protein
MRKDANPSDHLLSCVEVDRGSAMAAVVMIMTLAIILTMIFRKYVTGDSPPGR